MSTKAERRAARIAGLSDDYRDLLLALADHKRFAHVAWVKMCRYADTLDLRLEYQALETAHREALYQTSLEADLVAAELPKRLAGRIVREVAGPDAKFHMPHRGRRNGNCGGWLRRNS